jgi:hypothetical protein
MGINSYKMPEPILIATRPELDPFNLTARFFNLSQTVSFIRYGVEYKLDMDEYERRISDARERHRRDIVAHTEETITNGELEMRTMQYLECISTYNVIDEHGKTCGVYDSMTKTLNLFLRQVVIQGTIYYCDTVDRNVFTYAGSALGVLSLDETEIVEYEE